MQKQIFVRYPVQKKRQPKKRRRCQCPFADGKKLKSELDLQLLELLGPKTDADLAKPTKTKDAVFIGRTKFLFKI